MDGPGLDERAAAEQGLWHCQAGQPIVYQQQNGLSTGGAGALSQAGSRTIGFVTGEQKNLGAEKLLSVFVPTTPNPTSGFLLLVPEHSLVKLDMSVADGIKFVISLGAISPGQAADAVAALAPANDEPAPEI